jgi:hypothetical protein
MKTKRATVTFETERLLIISRSGRMVDRWCPNCHAFVKMLGIDEAAAITAVSQRTLFHLAEAGELHFTETEEGWALFCVTSLTASRKH